MFNFHWTCYIWDCLSFEQHHDFNFQFKTTFNGNIKGHHLTLNLTLESQSKITNEGSVALTYFLFAHHNLNFYAGGILVKMFTTKR